MNRILYSPTPLYRYVILQAFKIITITIMHLPHYYIYVYDEQEYHLETSILYTRVVTCVTCTSATRIPGYPDLKVIGILWKVHSPRVSFSLLVKCLRLTLSLNIPRRRHGRWYVFVSRFVCTGRTWFYPDRGQVLALCKGDVSQAD